MALVLSRIPSTGERTVTGISIPDGVTELTIGLTDAPFVGGVEVSMELTVDGVSACKFRTRGQNPVATSDVAGNAVVAGAPEGVFGLPLPLTTGRTATASVTVDKLFTYGLNVS